MKTQTETDSYWNDRYLEGRTGWDLGHPSAPLKAYIDQLADKDLAILIPGAGFGHEARYLVINGFTNVTVVDFSEVATQSLSTALSGQARMPKIICGDFFSQEGKYGLILEQTFFCAIPPSRRPDYVKKARALLEPGGKLAGVLFDQVFDKEDPPFGGTREEYERLLRQGFRLKTLAPCYNSAPGREELFFIAVAK